MELTIVLPFLLVAFAAFLIVVHSESLKLFTCPASQGNRTIHVDSNDFLHLNQEESREGNSPMELITYYVEATLGTGQGRRTYSLAIDTTSGVSWIQCVPCGGSNSSCFPQMPPPFDPSTSPTFLANSSICSEEDCEFRSSYPDGMVAKGSLVLDDMATITSHGNPYSKGPSEFACVHDSVGFKSHGVIAGVLSLSASMQAFSMHGQRMSYCLALPAAGNCKQQHRHGFLRFDGDVPATTHMQRTDYLPPPVDVDLGRNCPYFLSLVGVSVAGTTLRGINGKTFQIRDNGYEDHGGVVINPGVSTMVMVQPAYDIFEHAVKDHLMRSLAIGGDAFVSRFGYRLCINGSSTGTVWPHLPNVTLHFNDPTDVDMVLDPQQLFIGTSSEVACLAVLPGSMTVIGALQQINMRFTYDYDNSAIFFAPENCALDTAP